MHALQTALHQLCLRYQPSRMLTEQYRQICASPAPSKEDACFVITEFCISGLPGVSYPAHGGPLYRAYTTCCAMLLFSVLGPQSPGTFGNPILLYRGTAQPRQQPYCF